MNNDMGSVFWVSPDTGGIGNGLGYSHHNRMMRKYTQELIDIDDVFSDYALHIISADNWRPIEGKINILFTMWEFLDVPESYIKALSEADYVIVPCKFCKEIFQPYVKNRIYVCGEGIEEGSFPFYQRKTPDYKNGERFRVYWSGAPNPRKGYHYATEFIKIVESMPDMELYIKTTMPKVNYEQAKEKARKVLDDNKDLKPEAIAALSRVASGETTRKYMKHYLDQRDVKTYGRYNNIIFDTRRVPFDELVGLYNDAHVFILPSSGEGWGLMGCEAMGTGLPLIAPYHTGIKDYFDASVGFPIQYAIQEKDCKNYDIKARVFVPYYDEMVNRIFEVKKNYKQSLIKANKGSKRIHKTHIWSKKCKVLLSILNKIKKESLQDGNYQRICDSR